MLHHPGKTTKLTWFHFEQSPCSLDGLDDLRRGLRLLCGQPTWPHDQARETEQMDADTVNSVRVSSLATRRTLERFPLRDSPDAPRKMPCPSHKDVTY